MSEFRTAQVTRLTLTDFRNYTALTLDISASMVAFVGANGAGKTNILEAISFLTAGRGIRRAALADIVQKGAAGSWSVSANVLMDGMETRIGTGLVAGSPGRKTRIDGEDAKGSESLLDYVRVLWLVPAMDGLFTGSGSERRRFLDRLTLAIDPTHGRRVADFENALRQRNRLLEQSGSDSYLTALENQVSELGTAVSLARRETVGLLGQMIASQMAQNLPFPHAEVALEGKLRDGNGRSGRLGPGRQIPAATQKRPGKRPCRRPHAHGPAPERPESVACRKAHARRPVFHR